MPDRSSLEKRICEAGNLDPQRLRALIARIETDSHLDEWERAALLK